jgi:hypothetical protein
MRDSRPSTDDVKDMVIGGCPVRLTYGRTDGARWTVRATVTCGVGERAGEQSLVTKPCESREAAEQEALRQITAQLGHNVDRSQSPVRNWS